MNQKKASSIANFTSSHGKDLDQQVRETIEDFAAICMPLEKERLLLLEDMRTGAIYIECHLKASRLIELGTIDVPLDPDEQAEYRANREIVEDHVAFGQMKEDALAHRTFSNIVSEYTAAFDAEHPLKIIGGQHRFEAIRGALKTGVDEWHGIKIYFNLDNDQRIDVQLISNTNIAVSTDLFDRMQETLSGPQLRTWCQKTGLLEEGVDFADKRARSNPITVRAARTFIVNYFRGRAVDVEKFDTSETTPNVCRSGVEDSEWTKLKLSNPKLWEDEGLTKAGKAYAALIVAQRNAFNALTKKNKTANVDFAEKAMNFAVLSAWAFVAGLLVSNPARLSRHFKLKDQSGRDPLNAAVLAKGRHKSDPENYRGLGYRTDPKERGRLAELFFLQAEDGLGISAGKVDLAIKKYHAKEAQLEVERAKNKGPQ
jgi:hypothetical protein